MKIVWNKQAKVALQAIFDYIKTNSLQSAEKVRDTIIDSVASLDGKLVHRPDKYKRNNDGTYRAYEIYSYRISYRNTSPQKKY